MACDTSLLTAAQFSHLLQCLGINGFCTRFSMILRLQLHSDMKTSMPLCSLIQSSWWASKTVVTTDLPTHNLGRNWFSGISLGCEGIWK